MATTDNFVISANLYEQCHYNINAINRRKTKSHANSNLVFPKASCQSSGHCVWYGVCNMKDELKQNCAYNGTAKPLTDATGLGILKQWCPHLISNDKDVLTCCDTDQVS